ncbi:MAG: arsenate reductase family protein [Myxococcota bacterium]
MWTFYQYPSCSTCRSAKKWLEAQNIEVTAVHIVDAPPSRDEIERLWHASGLDLKRFFNTSGGSYRALKLKDTYAALSEDARLDLLAADGKLLKRPILTNGAQVTLVGFKQPEWEEVLGGGTP